MQRQTSGGGSGMCHLPTDCVARIASLTSPGDACRLAASAAALRPVADSDDVWGCFLPPDWAGALDGKSVTPPARRERESTKKEIFLRLCDSPVLLDGGKLSFSLEKRSGAKKCMMPARALCFGWSGYPYGGLAWLQNHPDSRFSEVAVLSHLCWLDIFGIFNTKHLSNDIGYVAYIVYNVQLLHTKDQKGGEEETTAAGSSSISSICSHECNHIVPHKHLRAPLCKLDYDGSPFLKANSNKTKELKYGGICVRSDGWMEQEISTEISVVKENNEENGDISIEFRGLTGSHQCQIIVEGIEIRPKN